MRRRGFASTSVVAAGRCTVAYSYLWAAVALAARRLALTRRLRYLARRGRRAGRERAWMIAATTRTGARDFSRRISALTVKGRFRGRSASTPRALGNVGRRNRNEKCNDNFRRPAADRLRSRS